MLEAFVMINQESVNPIGGTLYTLESDFSWKQKKQIVGTKPSANNYNLVQLTPVGESKIKKFSIQAFPTDLTDSSHSVLKDATEFKKEVNLFRKADNSPEHCARPLHSQMSTMPLAEILPIPCSIPEFMKQEDNPQYVNTMKNKPHFLATVVSTSDESVEHAKQYENWPGIERLQNDVSSDHKCNTPEYINW